MIEFRFDMIPHGDHLGKFPIMWGSIINNLQNKKRPKYGSYTVSIKYEGQSWTLKILSHKRDAGLIPLLSQIFRKLQDELQ